MADALRRDPVATHQIKEHIKPEELLELLGLETPEEEPMNIEDAIVQAGYSRRDALIFVCEYFTKSEILDVVNKYEHEEVR